MDGELGERQVEIYQQQNGWHALRYEGRLNSQSTLAMDTTPIAIALSVPPVPPIEPATPVTHNVGTLQPVTGLKVNPEG